MTLAIVPGRIARPAFRHFDRYRIFVAIILSGPRSGIGKFAGDLTGNLEIGFLRADTDRTDLVARDVAAAAEQRQDPAGIRVLAAPEVHAKPDHVFKARTMAFRLRLAPCFGRVGDQIFRFGHVRAVGMNEHGGDFGGRALGQQTVGQFAVAFVDFDRRQQFLQQPFAVLRLDCLPARRIGPFRGNLGVAQHRFHPLAARERNDEHRGALFPGAPRASRSVLQGFGIARDLDMNDEAERRQVDPACSDVGGDADPRPPIAQCLKRLIPFRLRMLTRQRDHGKTAFLQGCMQVPDLLAGRAEQDGRFCIVIAQDIDDGVLDLGRGYRHRLIRNVAVAAALADCRNPFRIALIAARENFDRARDRGGKQQRPAGVRRCIENFLELFAKAHVEHLVCFIEHNRLEPRQVESTAFKVVAEPPRGADDYACSCAQRLAFLRRVHPAHARRDAAPGLCVKPRQFAADLQCQFAGRCHDQRKGRGRRQDPAVFAKQFLGHGKAKGDRLARTGLGGDDQITASRLRLQDFGLHGRRRRIATFGKGGLEAVGKGREIHGIGLI